MPQPAPLQYVFYFAASPDKVWEGFVSPESNRIIFGGADLEIEIGAHLAPAPHTCHPAPREPHVAPFLSPQKFDATA